MINDDHCYNLISFLDNKILLFGTIEFLGKLCTADTVYMDGTFKSCPLPFKQIYTLHCFIMGKMFPIAYGLLPDKTKQTYVRLLNLVKQIALDHQLNFQPQTFQIDFELGMLAAIQEQFPTSRVRGCYFHYTQCIWRKVQELGLVKYYKKDKDINALVRRMAAFPLLPLHLIDDVFLQMHSDAPLNQSCNELIDYFVEQWVHDIRPKISRTIWSHYNNNGARTNNHLEGWHSFLNKKVGKHHPNLFELIFHLQTIQQKNEQDLESIKNGGSIPQAKLVYRKLDESLKNLKVHLSNNEITPIRFLDAVSHRIRFLE